MLTFFLFFFFFFFKIFLPIKLNVHSQINKKRLLYKTKIFRFLIGDIKSLREGFQILSQLEPSARYYFQKEDHARRDHSVQQNHLAADCSRLAEHVIASLRGRMARDLFYGSFARLRHS